MIINLSIDTKHVGIVYRCDLVHIEPDLFRMLPRLEVLGLRDNDLNCLPIDELPYLRMLRTVRIDGNPWLCECRRKLDEYFRSRSIVQEVECLKQINDCRKYQCMTPIGFTVLPSTLTTQQLHDFNRVSTWWSIYNVSKISECFAIQISYAHFLQNLSFYM